MDKDLKPCPFCGEHGKPEIKTEMFFEHIRGIEMPFYKVECQECLIGYDYSDCKTAAIRRWNYRANDYPNKITINKFDFNLVCAAIDPFWMAHEEVQSVDEFEDAIRKSSGLYTLSIAVKQNLMQSKVSPKNWSDLSKARFLLRKLEVEAEQKS